MTSFDFQTQTHGKWILTGEHAVLRGATALVFPILSRQLTLKYSANSDPVRVEFTGPESEELQLLFWGVLEQALERIGTSLNEVHGIFSIDNNIPLGTGMGASAALCVSLARWFEQQKLLENTSTAEFARLLENLFHSESSGVDIAGVGAEQGLVFSRGQPPQLINACWQPNWYLSPSDQVGMTNHCVKKVKELCKQQQSVGQRIDQLMQNSSDLALQALRNHDEKQRLEQLANAINQAKICFTQWGLCSGKLEQRIDQLLQAGAIAAKPTGSGDGGYILSLWETPAKANVSFDLIPV